MRFFLCFLHTSRSLSLSIRFAEACSDVASLSVPLFSGRRLLRFLSLFSLFLLCLLLVLLLSSLRVFRFVVKRRRTMQHPHTLLPSFPPSFLAHSLTHTHTYTHTRTVPMGTTVLLLWLYFSSFTRHRHRTRCCTLYDHSKEVSSSYHHFHTLLSSDSLS